MTQRQFGSALISSNINYPERTVVRWEKGQSEPRDDAKYRLIDLLEDSVIVPADSGTSCKEIVLKIFDPDLARTKWNKMIEKLEKREFFQGVLYPTTSDAEGVKTLGSPDRHCLVRPTTDWITLRRTDNRAIMLRVRHDGRIEIGMPHDTILERVGPHRRPIEELPEFSEAGPKLEKTNERKELQWDTLEDAARSLVPDLVPAIQERRLKEMQGE